MKLNRLVKLLIKVLLVFLILFSLFTYRYSNLQSLDTFTIGYKKKEITTSKSYRLLFYYDVGGKQYIGKYQTGVNPKLNRKNQNSYLIAYNKESPDRSFIFLDFPIESTVNIDSINSTCSPSDLFSIWDYINSS